MSDDKDKIIEAIYDAMDEISAQSPDIPHLEKSTDTVLLGKTGALDSLGFVNLIVAAEQKIEEKFDLCITLVDEKAMSKKNSPFKTVGTLRAYISRLLEEHVN
jgi:acyl carrier protein